MARMKRGKRPPAAPDWQPPELDEQCFWCGKVLKGKQEGQTLDYFIRASHKTCPECAEEYHEQGHRDYERHKLERAGVPPEQWPPRFLSRLEQRTGNPRGVEPPTEPAETPEVGPEETA